MVLESIKQVEGRSRGGKQPGKAPVTHRAPDPVGAGMGGSEEWCRGQAASASSGPRPRTQDGQLGPVLLCVISIVVTLAFFSSDEIRRKKEEDTASFVLKRFSFN